MVGEGHVFEALKAIRSLYALEREALGDNDDEPQNLTQTATQGGRR
jgi:flagellar biosynthesis repressor protein FlbT